MLLRVKEGGTYTTPDAALGQEAQSGLSQTNLDGGPPLVKLLKP